MSQWLRIERLATQPRDRKTPIYLVTTVHSNGNSTLGWIKFYPQWRSFAFHPRPNTLYEQACLRQIAEFCEQETRRWSNELSRKKAAAKREGTL